MKMSTFKSFIDKLSHTQKIPALFVGHGNPMNALDDNQFVRGFKSVVEGAITPKAILVISAHWETRGTQLTAMKQPKTIHDFYGFPPDLYQIQYPAPGSPELAHWIQQSTQHPIELDHDWGLDHGSWTVLKHMYPDASIPVLEMSLDTTKSIEQHFALAQELKFLREHGVLIIGSGNIVHNLGKIDWKEINNNKAFDWALEANERIKELIIQRDYKTLLDFKNQGAAFDLAIPTNDHYLPLLYSLALTDKSDEFTFFNDEHLGGSISMTSLKIS